MQAFSYIARYNNCIVFVFSELDLKSTTTPKNGYVYVGRRRQGVLDVEEEYHGDD